MIHGEEEALKAQEASKALFGGGGNSANMPTYKLVDDDYRDGVVDLIGILVAAKLVPTRSEGRRSIEQGGVAVDGEKVTDIKAMFTKESIPEEGLVLRRGKKNFRKVVV
jgi:tyrosyl-tRNA synthetase